MTFSTAIPALRNSSAMLFTSFSKIRLYIESFPCRNNAV
jgi:hypothetical protein